MLQTVSNNILKNAHPTQPFNKNIVIVTGELSGEIHAANLVKRLKESVSLTFSGMGSKRLKEENVHIVTDYQSISVTGLSEVFSRIHKVYRAYTILTQHIQNIKPGLVILVDFPGFNMKIAKFSKTHNIPVIYFIPPQVWAWRKNRIKQIKKYVDKVICILPFEKPLYDHFGIETVYVGHPFTQTVRPFYSNRAEFIKNNRFPEDKPIIAILPGSRHNEVAKHMLLLLRIIQNIENNLKGCTVILPLAENIDPSFVEKLIQGKDNIVLLKGLTYDALAYSDIAIVASGSATLEAALLGVPTIVVYKISWLSYLIAKKVVDVRYISLPNLIARKEVFPEYIQHINPEIVAKKALDMLKNDKRSMQKDIDFIRMQLGTQNAYDLAKDAILQFLSFRYGTLS